jgi:hypothetical protein
VQEQEICGLTLSSLTVDDLAELGIKRHHVKAMLSWMSKKATELKIVDGGTPNGRFLASLPEHLAQTNIKGWFFLFYDASIHHIHYTKVRV